MKSEFKIGALALTLIMVSLIGSTGCATTRDGSGDQGNVEMKREVGKGKWVRDELNRLRYVWPTDQQD